MEKQKITEAQYRAILNFINALKQLEAEGVDIVRDNDDDSLLFFNGKDIEQFVIWDDRADYPEAVDITDYADSIKTEAIVKSAYYPYYNHERVMAVLKSAETQS